MAYYSICEVATEICPANHSCPVLQMNCLDVSAHVQDQGVIEAEVYERLKERFSRTPLALQAALTVKVKYGENAIELIYRSNVKEFAGKTFKRWQLKRMAYRTEYLATPYWLDVAMRKRETIGWKCERCPNRGRGEYLQIHHRNSDYSHKGDERLELLEALCPDCHMAEHGISQAA